MKERRLVFACLLLLSVLIFCGCNLDTRNLIHSGNEPDKFVRVEIVFTDGHSLTTYLKDLGMERDARVYVGGTSTNNFYDAKGNVIGAFNYQRVLYIKILPPITRNEADS